MQGMVEGKRRRGRPRRVWIDDVKEWRGCETQHLCHMACIRMIGGKTSIHEYTDDHWGYGLYDDSVLKSLRTSTGLSTVEIFSAFPQKIQLPQMAGKMKKMLH